ARQLVQGEIAETAPCVAGVVNGERADTRPALFKHQTQRATILVIHRQWFHHDMRLLTRGSYLLLLRRPVKTNGVCNSTVPLPNLSMTKSDSSPAARWW